MKKYALFITFDFDITWDLKAGEPYQFTQPVDDLERIKKAQKKLQKIWGKRAKVEIKEM